MAKIADSTADFKQCLKDIGCDEKTVKDFKDSDKSSRIRILKKQRRTLMDSIHENQKRIDRVDYIIDKIERGW